MNRKTAALSIIALPVLFVFIGQACSDTKLSAIQQPLPTIGLSIQNYCPLAGFSFRDIFVYNASAEIVGNSWSADFDRDGLPDVLEKSSPVAMQFGVSSLLSNTANPGYSDLVIVNMGLGLAAQNLLPNCANPASDTDQDGLNDCTENYIQTNSQKADTDGDGIPDGIEFRFGLNPRDSNDAFQSLMGDGLTNLEKIKAGLPVGLMATDQIKKLGLVYNVVQQPIVNPSLPTCYNINVTNIPLMAVTNGNKIYAYAVEDKPVTTSGVTVLDRETRWLAAVVPASTANHSTVLINDGIHQQTVDGVIIPLVVQPGGGS